MGRSSPTGRSPRVRFAARALRAPAVPVPGLDQLLAFRQDGFEPVEDGRGAKARAHGAHAAPPLRGRHLERFANTGDKIIDVEGIDQKRSLDLFGGARESTENQNAVLI